MAGAYEYGGFEFPDEVLLPRYYLGDPRPTIHRRQDSKCEENHHQCVDIGFPGTCCPNDQYCYVDPEAVTARCCALERNCDPQCRSTAYYCEKTSTITGDSPSTTVSGACCPRVCTSQSFYRCEEEQGGGCCPYDQACSADRCVATITSTLPPLVTPVDEGCTTGQSRCDDGDGCCDTTRKCTQLSGTAVCAPADFTAPGEVVDSSSSDSLSSGAKAGIGVGVAIGASLITAGLTFLYLRRRARKRAALNAAPPREEDDPGDVELTTMSPEPGGAGLVQDYFGPDAREGPFTEGEAKSPGARATGVPAQPNEPDDIVVPIEIDSTGVTPMDGEGRATKKKGPELYELQGSDVPELPSPSPGEQASPSNVGGVVVESPVLGTGTGNKAKAADVDSPVLPAEDLGNRRKTSGEGSPSLPTEGQKNGDKPDDGESPILPPSGDGQGKNRYQVYV